ncbi:MAG: ankyrin repeat domain-containing protein, partial [Candidatus Poribacteria bacterium]|nr:ankyrin repeat domain-containing protein [Candidatus Poribacteria bacterium]
MRIYCIRWYSKIVSLLCILIFGNIGIAEELTFDDIFPADRVLDVQITVDEEDWDTVRHQSRNFASALDVRRKTEPIESPYTYVDASVTIDGVSFPEVGIRKKGFLGSLNAFRPSLKIKLNHVDKKASIEGLTNLTLNNNQQDHSLVSQFMGYALFNAAGSPAPRCAYAKVTVNGVNLGVYSHVESIRNPLLQRVFGDDRGSLYEGPYVDFYEGWLGSFEFKRGKEKPGREKIHQLINVLKDEGEDMESAIGELVDLDSFYTYWAVEGLLGFWDGYSGNNNNFFMYLNPETDRFHFIPWGADSLFTKHSKLEHQYDPRAPISVKTQGLIAHKLYQLQSARERYASEITNLLENHWNESEMLSTIDQIEKMTTPHLIQQQQFFRGDEDRRRGGKSFADALEETRKFIRQRRADVSKEIADGMPIWEKAPSEPFVIENTFHGDNIWSAAAAGDVESLNMHLAKGANVHIRDKAFGVTPLTSAALFGKTETAELLIKNGADVNQKNRDGGTALHGAAFLGHADTARLLLNNGADVNAENYEGVTPLNAAYVDWETTKAIAGYLQIDVDEEAVESGRTRIIELFDQYDAQLGESNSDSQGDELCEAAAAGDIEAAKALLIADADPNARDSELGVTPLSWATLFNQVKVAEFLIQKGADVNARNRDGGTSLHGAAFLGYADIAALLIQKGADVNARNTKGESPLDVSKVDWGITQLIASWLEIELDQAKVEAGRTAVVKMLQEHSSADTGRSGDDMCAAVRRGDIETVKVLLAKGADTNTGDSQFGVSPLSWAALLGQTDIAELLIRNDADVNARNRDGGTALHGAAFLGHADMAELLVRKGADVNAANDKGE